MKIFIKKYLKSLTPIDCIKSLRSFFFFFCETFLGIFYHFLLVIFPQSHIFVLGIEDIFLNFFWIIYYGNKYYFFKSLNSQHLKWKSFYLIIYLSIIPLIYHNLHLIMESIWNKQCSYFCNNIVLYNKKCSFDDFINLQFTIISFAEFMFSIIIFNKDEAKYLLIAFQMNLRYLIIYKFNI